jgi:hypothetical protein
VLVIVQAGYNGVYCTFATISNMLHNKKRKQVYFKGKLIGRNDMSFVYLYSPIKTISSLPVEITSCTSFTTVFSAAV